MCALDNHTHVTAHKWRETTTRAEVDSYTGRFAMFLLCCSFTGKHTAESPEPGPPGQKPRAEFLNPSPEGIVAPPHQQYGGPPVIAIVLVLITTITVALLQQRSSRDVVCTANQAPRGVRNGGGHCGPKKSFLQGLVGEMSLLGTSPTLLTSKGLFLFLLITSCQRIYNCAACFAGCDLERFRGVHFAVVEKRIKTVNCLEVCFVLAGVFQRKTLNYPSVWNHPEIIKLFQTELQVY